LPAAAPSYTVRLGDQHQVPANTVLNNKLSVYETARFKYYVDPEAYLTKDTQVKDHKD